MKKYLRIVLLGLLLAVAFSLASCAGADSAQQQGSGSGDTQEETTAPEALVQNGEYSDERFIDMMVPHHQMAVDMAKVAEDNAEHPEIKQLADNIVSTQQDEIKEMRSIREQEYGSSETPVQMAPSEMANMGMTPPDQLANQQPFDKAFIDSMMPHHSSAIEMASVATMRSDNQDIQRIARGIIDGQAKEIGQMIGWRQQWYPED